jgi:transposase
MKRFEKCNNWFITINKKIISGSLACYDAPSWMKGKTMIGFDASDVSEKGRSRRIFRLHFALDIFNMKSQEHLITTAKTGESLTNFSIKKDCYTTIKGIEHCTQNGADYILRLRKNSFTLRDENNEKIDLLSLFAKLQNDEYADISAYATNLAGAKVPVRVCAKRKTADAIEKTKKRLKRKESQSKYKMSDEAKTFNEFIVLVTNIENTTATAHEILEAYRYRWQIEIYFKRLKSIMDFGELPKKRENSSIAWLNGKLMVALLIELLIAKFVFSPTEKSKTQYMA